MILGCVLLLIVFTMVRKDSNTETLTDLSLMDFIKMIVTVETLINVFILCRHIKATRSFNIAADPPDILKGEYHVGRGSNNGRPWREVGVQ